MSYNKQKGVTQMTEIKETHHKLDSIQEYLEHLEEKASKLRAIAGMLECQEDEVVEVFESYYEEKIPINVHKILDLVERAIDSTNNVRGSVEDASDAVSIAQSEIEYLDINDSQYEIDDSITELEDCRTELKETEIYKSSKEEDSVDE